MQSISREGGVQLKDITQQLEEARKDLERYLADWRFRMKHSGESDFPLDYEQEIAARRERIEELERELGSAS